MIRNYFPGVYQMSDTITKKPRKPRTKRTVPKQLVGTRIQVWNGTAKKTAYGSKGLTRNDLMLNKFGRLVSKRASARATRSFDRISDIFLDKRAKPIGMMDGDKNVYYDGFYRPDRKTENSRKSCKKEGLLYSRKTDSCRPRKPYVKKEKVQVKIEEMEAAIRRLRRAIAARRR